MVIGFTPVGAYYAGKEFEEAWLDFGASDKKDVKRVTTATLNLMLLGIGTKKAMAEYRASKEILTHADELERSGKVDEAKAYRETAAYKKADATDKLLNLNRQMKDTHQSISNYIQERNDKLTTWSRTTKDKFSADSLKPAQNVIRESDLPAKTKVTVKDPLVIDDLIENSFTNDSFFYEVADKEFYVSDWDIVKVEKPKKFDSMSEQASKEMQDYLRVIKVKTKDTRAGFEDQYIEKDILLIIEDKMLVSKENADAVSSLELPSNLANGAEKLFTYDSVFGNTPDLIVIHMSKDLMNKPEAFSYALAQQMAELTAIKDALIKHEEGLPEAQMKKVIKEAEEPIHFDMTDEALVDQLYEIMKEDPDSEVAQQFMEQISENACFPAGTRITTDKGLKRIEDIQVGDMVLSKHESGIGEQEFKPVVRTVVHHNKPIFELTYAVVKNTTKENSLSDKAILKLSQKGNVSVIRATPNHPFWVKGQGWTSLDKLQKGQLLELKDSDTLAYVIFVSPEYQTNHVNITASYGFENEINFGDKFIDSEYSKLYTFNKYENNGDFSLLRNGENVESPINDMNIGEISATNQVSLQTVYNFEVADNHTYYIFDEIWVHNDNCPVIPREKIESYDGSEVPKDMPFFNSLKEANDFFKSLPEDSDLLVPAIVRVGRVKVNSVTKGKINAVDFEHGSRNAIYAKIGDEYIQFEYIAFRKHPNYQTVDTNGVVTTNNSVLNFVKFEGFTEEMINGKLVKSYIDRKASLPYQALSTKKVAPAEKGVDGKLEFANAARHYAIDNLYNQLDSLTRTQNADHNLIYALKKQADIDVFNVQILEAIKDNSFELWKVDTDGHRTRTINGEPTKVWEGYKLKEVDSQSAQYKCKLLNINTNLNITGLITKNNKSMVCQNHLLKRVIKKLTFNGCF